MFALELEKMTSFTNSASFRTMNLTTHFALALVASIAFAPLALLAQLPDGIKSDLGPGVPNMKVRPAIA
jgi:hypothetical protein